MEATKVAPNHLFDESEIDLPLPPGGSRRASGIGDGQSQRTQLLTCADPEALNSAYDCRSFVGDR